MSRTALITGATGALGPAVLRAFQDADWHVRTLSRTPPAAGTAAAKFPHVAADTGDTLALADAMRGSSVVVHMAALLHIVDPGPELEAEYWRVNVEGTRSVMEMARATGVKRVVFISSICVYGVQDGPVDEETRPNPDSPYATTKRQAEELVLDARSEERRPLGVVLRLGAVYGPRIKGNYYRLARAVGRGRFVAVGAGTNRRTLVFEEDAAQAVVVAATHPEAAGRVYNVTDGGYHTVAEITKAIADAFGKPMPRISVPLSLARLAVAVLESGSRAIGRKPLVSRAALEKYTEEIVVSGKRIRGELGFKARYDLAEGWRRTASEMRAEGRL